MLRSWCHPVSQPPHGGCLMEYGADAIPLRCYGARPSQPVPAMPAVGARLRSHVRRGPRVPFHRTGDSLGRSATPTLSFIAFVIGIRLVQSILYFFPFVNRRVARERMVFRLFLRAPAAGGRRDGPAAPGRTKAGGAVRARRAGRGGRVAFCREASHFGRELRRELLDQRVKRRLVQPLGRQRTGHRGRSSARRPAGRPASRTGSSPVRWTWSVNVAPCTPEMSSAPLAVRRHSSTPASSA